MRNADGDQTGFVTLHSHRRSLGKDVRVDGAHGTVARSHWARRMASRRATTRRQPTMLVRSGSRASLASVAVDARDAGARARRARGRRDERQDNHDQGSGCGRDALGAGSRWLLLRPEHSVAGRVRSILLRASGVAPHLAAADGDLVERGHEGLGELGVAPVGHRGEGLAGHEQRPREALGLPLVVARAVGPLQP
jgi:hypothetical protein